MKEKADFIEEVQTLIISFSKDKLTTEEELVCMHIWKKLTRKRTLDITRTRADIWAGAVIWSFCRANFKYEEGITLDTVCDFFSNKKSTVGNKAGEIIKMLKIDYFKPEFSTEENQSNNPFKAIALDANTGLLVFKEAEIENNEPSLKKTVKKPARYTEEDTPQMKLI
jgi:hypothetical protein